MSTQRKSWEDHSPRWKREKAKAGWSKRLFDRWRKLSPKSRKAVPVDAYAKGVSVHQFQQGSKVAAAASAVEAAKPYSVSMSKVRANLRVMTPEELAWTAKATPDQIQARARNPKYERRVGGKILNPWWYR